MKSVIVGIIILCSVSLAYSQSSDRPNDLDTTYWSTKLSAGINLNQTSFSGNWRGGGVNSFSSGTIVEARASYERDRITFDNEVELLYGIVRQQGQDVRKANDRIFLDTKAGYELNDSWGSYLSLNFLTQFTDGFDYDDDDERTLTSSFLSPGYLTGSLGFEYRPNDDFSLRVGPLSPRLTFMRDDAVTANVPENYGVPVGNTVRTEWLAFQLYATWDKEIAEDFTIKSRYQMFANYETLAWDSIDHRLDVTLTAQITNMINVTFTSINLYDIDQDPGIQYSTGLALGILYKIRN